MTLNDILVASLAQLDRGHDAQTVEIYRSRLIRYINDAQSDLADAVALTRRDTVVPAAGVVRLTELPRVCRRVEKVEQLGKSVPFRAGDEPNTLFLPYDAPASITYRCEPSPLKNADDVSELNESLHPLLVNYAVGRERMGGDVSTQSGGNIYLSMYSAAKQRLKGYLKADDSFRIVNKYS